MDRKGVRTVVAVASLAGALVVAAPASAAPGDLDPAFGTGGKTVTDLPGNVLRAPAVGLQSDGKLIVAGYTDAGVGFVARYSTSGILDDGGDGPGGAGFGTGDGYVTFDFGAPSPTIRGGAVQGDDKIVVVGSSGDDFGIARLLPNGTLDSSFDGDGKVTADFGRVIGDTALDVAIQPADGKIVVGGIGGASSDFALARYNADGSLDSSFDGDGKLTTDFAGTDFVDSLAIQVDGKIVAVGLGAGDWGLARYNADGSLDDGGDGPAGTGFGGDGKVTTNIGASDFATGVAIQPDGKILVGGEGGNNFNLARYNAADGSLDPSFNGDGNGDGKVTSDFGGTGDEEPTSLVLQNDGFINLVGYTDAAPVNINAVVAHYTPNGKLDTRFGTGGSVVVDFASTPDYAEAAVMQPGNKLTFVGMTDGPDDHAFLARVDADTDSPGNLDWAFGGLGKTVTNLPGSVYAVSIAQQSDGKLIVGGGDNGLTSVFVARYTADGVLDDGGDGPGGAPGWGVTGDGYTTFDWGGGGGANPSLSGIAVQGDDKIVAVGKSSGDFAVARLNADGLFDNGFDGNGRLTTDFGATEGASAVAVQPSDGKIVVAGNDNGTDFTLARYNGADGSLDDGGDGAGPLGFDVDGKLKTDLLGANDRANSVAIDANGKIVVGGGAGISEFGLVRYNGADGSLDDGGDGAGGAGFGGDGKVTTDMGSNDAVSSLAIQPDGKIVAAGTAGASGDDFGVARYNPLDGSLDSSFDGDGKVTSDFGNGEGVVEVLVQSDGFINVVGNTDGGGAAFDAAIAHYTPSGTLDTAFSNDGFATVDFGTGDNFAESAVVQTGKRLTFVGEDLNDVTLGRVKTDTDSDNDGVVNPTDNCPTTANPNQANHDGDGLGNACDADDDNDTIADGSDACALGTAAGADTDGDGCKDAGEDADDDNDTIADGSDACPIGAAGGTDTDGDGCKDAGEDADDDNDTIADGSDNCALVANTNQANNDADAQGDVCDADDDNDTIADGSDNCALVANTNQANNDADAQGDVCDADDDNDDASRRRRQLRPGREHESGQQRRGRAGRRLRRRRRQRRRTRRRRQLRDGGERRADELGRRRPGRRVRRRRRQRRRSRRRRCVPAGLRRRQQRLRRWAGPCDVEPDALALPLGQEVQGRADRRRHRLRGGSGGRGLPEGQGPGPEPRDRDDEAEREVLAEEEGTRRQVLRDRGTEHSGRRHLPGREVGQGESGLNESGRPPWRPFVRRCGCAQRGFSVFTPFGAGVRFLTSSKS